MPAYLPPNAIAPVLVAPAAAGTPMFGADYRSEMTEIIALASARLHLWNDNGVGTPAVAPKRTDKFFLGGWSDPKPTVMLAAISDGKWQPFTGYLDPTSHISGQRVGYSDASSGQSARFTYQFDGRPRVASDSSSAAGEDGRISVSSLIKTLRELPNSWNGGESVAPSAKIRADIEATLTLCGITVRQPEIEVDDDGSVALLWDGDEGTFGLTFVGNGKVVGTLSPLREAYLPWSTPIAEVSELSARLASNTVRPLLT